MASYALNNVATADTFGNAATLLCPSSKALTVQIYNASVFYQLLKGPDGAKGTGGAWEPPEGAFLGPSMAMFGPGDFAPFGVCHGIRFRSAVAGKPAQVTASG